jgi:hypothetical protein
LQLGFYVILGQDWLYQYSPMKINWPNKRLEIVDHDKDVFLHGVEGRVVLCHSITMEQLSGLHRVQDVEQILVIAPVTQEIVSSESAVPEEIQSVLR